VAELGDKLKAKSSIIMKLGRDDELAPFWREGSQRGKEDDHEYK